MRRDCAPRHPRLSPWDGFISMHQSFFIAKPNFRVEQAPSASTEASRGPISLTTSINFSRKERDLYDAVRRPRNNHMQGRMQLEHTLPCVSHRAFAGIATGDVGELLPFDGARSQNIENNPMQSSRRPSVSDRTF